MALPVSDSAPIPSALDDEGLDRVARLIAGWQPLADLCFSDLLLVAPSPDTYTTAADLFTMFGLPARAAAVRAEARTRFGR